MKFLAMGDSQLGATTVDLADQEQVWDRIVDVALDRQVDAVIHGGDLLDGPVVHPEHLLAFRRPLRRLREASIPTIVIRGNHDRAVRPVDGLDVFHEYDLLTIVQKPAVHMVGDTAICCLPWAHPGRLIAETDGAVDHDLVNQRAANLLVRIARDMRGVSSTAVLVAHWSISGSALPTGLPVDEMREPILPWAELDALGYDAIIGAHVHQPQQISQPLVDKTLGIVVGSPQQLNFGEHGEHGVWILEIDSSDGEAVAEFVPIESKRFETVTLNDDWKALAGDSNVVWGPFDGDVVRVRYQADENGQVDDAALRRHLLEAGASRVQIEPQIVRKDRARVTAVNEQLSQAEALAAWCDANEIDSAMRERMIERLGAWA